MLLDLITLFLACTCQIQFVSTLSYTHRMLMQLVFNNYYYYTPCLVSSFVSFSFLECIFLTQITHQNYNVCYNRIDFLSMQNQSFFYAQTLHYICTHITFTQRDSLSTHTHTHISSLNPKKRVS